ncbi:MAG: hypothetical protein ACXWWJ_04350 [Nitrospira sp.]
MNGPLNSDVFKPQIIHIGNGVSTTFAYSFQIFSTQDLEVYVDGDRQVSGFTINGVGSKTGGAVILDHPPADGHVLTLRRHLRPRGDQRGGQDTGSQPGVDVLDYQAAVLQQLEYALSRTVRLSPTDADAELVLPGAAKRSNTTLGFDDTGAVLVKHGLPSGDGTETGTDSRFEPVFAKKSAFNKDFGNVAGTVCEGDDPRLPPPPSGRASEYLDGTGKWSTPATGSWSLADSRPAQLLFHGAGEAVGGVSGSLVSDSGDLTLNGDFTVSGDNAVTLTQAMSLLGRYAIARDPAFIEHRGGDVEVTYTAPRVRLVLHADAETINAPRPPSGNGAVYEQIIEIEQAEGGPWSIKSWTEGAFPYRIDGAGPPQIADDGVTEVLTYFDNGAWHVIGTFEVSKLPAASRLSGSDMLTIYGSGISYRTTIAELKRPIVTVASTTRTLSADDAWKYLRCTSESPTTITINQDVFAAGDEITVRQAGTGTVSLSGTAKANGVFTFSQHKVATLKFIDSASYDLVPGA